MKLLGIPDGAAARAVSPRVLAQPAARPVADLVPRLGAAAADRDLRAHRLPLPPRLLPGPRRQLGIGAGRLDFDLLLRLADLPAWLYAFTQGLHVVSGFAVIPILLAKLWSVMPRLFEWPPVRCVAHALDRSRWRCSSAAASSSSSPASSTSRSSTRGTSRSSPPTTTGRSSSSRRSACTWSRKLPVALPRVPRAGRAQPLREDLAHTEPEPPRERLDRAAVAGGADDLAPRPARDRRRRLARPRRDRASASRSAGRFAGSPSSRRAGRTGAGPNDFQVNKTAATAGSSAAMTGPRLAAGARRADAGRAQPRATCSRWSSAPRRCRSPASRAGRRRRTGPASRCATSRALGGRRGRRRGDRRVAAEGRLVSPGDATRAARSPTERSLLALQVNGADLSLDHGYPARVIIPAAPGVHCTKWVASITFAAV